jgi:hypothetical protein
MPPFSSHTMLAQEEEDEDHENILMNEKERNHVSRVEGF